MPVSLKLVSKIAVFERGASPWPPLVGERWVVASSDQPRMTLLDRERLTVVSQHDMPEAGPVRWIGPEQLLMVGRFAGVWDATQQDWRWRNRIVNLEAFAAPAPFSFGSAPRAMDELRQFPVLTESLSISKRLPRIGPASIELQGQLMNAFNRVRFANFDPNYSSVNFGKARSTSLPRYLQLGVKVTF
jgi:hypothetical protein